MTSVIPIPPSFDAEGDLEIKSTLTYIKFLETQKVSTVMTTAGTSLFNLLTENEIRRFNETMYSTLIPKKIIGVPPLSLNAAKKFVDKQSENFSFYEEKDYSYMFLYPDRFYEEDVLLDYFRELKDHIKSGIYIHAMPMRNGKGGEWNYTSSVLNKLYSEDVLIGIKEEYFNLAAAYNFVNDLLPGIDVIVAGGSIRRFEFLKNAGANSFLAGIGNVFPSIENDYLLGNTKSIELENKFFNTMMKHGWHRTLRIALSIKHKTCLYDRKPWPIRYEKIVQDVHNILEEIENEK